MKPLNEKMQRVVKRQADDDGLWFISTTAPEAYLQEALRNLHRYIEEMWIPKVIQIEENHIEWGKRFAELANERVQLEADLGECRKLANSYIDAYEKFAIENGLQELEAHIERLGLFRNELAGLIDPNEPHDMGGPHISLNWIIEHLDALKEE